MFEEIRSLIALVILKPFSLRGTKYAHKMWKVSFLVCKCCPSLSLFFVLSFEVKGALRALTEGGTAHTQQAVLRLLFLSNLSSGDSRGSRHLWRSHSPALLAVEPARTGCPGLALLVL